MKKEEEEGGEGDGEDNCQRAAAAWTIQAAFRARCLACRRRGERLQRAQPVRVVLAVHSKAQSGTTKKARSTISADANMPPGVGDATVPVPAAKGVCKSGDRVAVAAAATPASLTPDADARFDTTPPPTNKGNRGEEAPSVIVPPSPSTLPARPKTASASESAQARKIKKNAKRKAARARKRERELGPSTGLAEEGACSATWQRLLTHQNTRSATSEGARAEERRGQAARIIGNAGKRFFSAKAAPTRTGGALGLPEVEVVEGASGRSAAAPSPPDTKVTAGGAGKITCMAETAPAHFVDSGGDERPEAGRGARETGRGNRPPQAPASLQSFQPTATRRTVPSPAEERRPMKTERKRESRMRKKQQLKLEDCRQEAAALRDANTSGHRAFPGSAAEAATAPRHESTEPDSERETRLGRTHPPVHGRTRGITASSGPFAPPGEKRPPAPAVQVVAAACYTYVMAMRRAKRVERQRCGLEETALAVGVGSGVTEVRPMEEGGVLAMKENVEAQEEESARKAWAKAVLLGMIRRFQRRKADVTATALAATTEANFTQIDAAKEGFEPTTAETPAAAEETQQQTLEKTLVAKANQALKERQHSNAAAERQAREQESERNAIRSMEAGSSLHQPPSRQHTPAAPDTETTSSRSTSEGCELDLHSYVPHPLQLVEGKTLLYDPKEFGLWPLMVQLRGWSLELGVAPVWVGGNQREAEAFSAACGFSAAWGPIVLKRVATAVYGKVFASGVSVLPTDHVIYAFGHFWDKAITPFDAAERFFRLVKLGCEFPANSGGNGGGGIGKVRKTVLK